MKDTELNRKQWLNYLESHDEQRVVKDIKDAGFDDEIAAKKSALGAVILFTSVGIPMIYHGQAWGQDTPLNMDHNYIDWDKLGTDRGRGLRDHYAAMAALRGQNPAIRTANIQINAILHEQKCIIYHRWNNEGNIVLVAANFSPHNQNIEIPIPESGNWKEFFTQSQYQANKSVNIEIDSYAARILIKS